MIIPDRLQNMSASPKKATELRASKALSFRFFQVEFFHFVFPLFHFLGDRPLAYGRAAPTKGHANCPFQSGPAGVEKKAHSRLDNRLRNHPPWSLPFHYPPQSSSRSSRTQRGRRKSKKSHFRHLFSFPLSMVLCSADCWEWPKGRKTGRRIVNIYYSWHVRK